MRGNKRESSAYPHSLFSPGNPLTLLLQIPGRKAFLIVFPLQRNAYTFLFMVAIREPQTIWTALFQLLSESYLKITIITFALNQRVL